MQRIARRARQPASVHAVIGLQMPDRGLHRLTPPEPTALLIRERKVRTLHGWRTMVLPFMVAAVCYAWLPATGPIAAFGGADFPAGIASPADVPAAMLSVQAAARRWSGQHGPITILYRPARQPWLAQVMQTARNRPGIAAVPTTLQGVRQMLKALRRGEAVGLLPDQVPPQGLGLWSPFFGREAYTMTLAARLVQQTGASVILARCERLTFGRGYVLHLQDLAAPLAPELEAAVLQINQAMEQLIRQSPEQYLWGYARYKQPRAEMHGSRDAAEGGA